MYDGQLLARKSIPSDWQMISEKTNFVSIVLPKKCEFNNVRAISKVVVSKTAITDTAFITIKAQGCQKYLSDVPRLFYCPFKVKLVWIWRKSQNPLFVMS